MNFTHLFKPGEDTPSQEVLQSLSWFVMIVVLSDADVELARASVGAQLMAAEKAGCWIVQKRDIEVAPLGSPMRKAYESFMRHPTYSGTEDHSFIAWMHRVDFMHGRINRESIHFKQLELYDHKEPAARAAALAGQVQTALEHMEPREQASPLADLRAALVVALFEKVIGL